MVCRLCEKEITDYSPLYNRLVLNESQAVDICQECVHKIVKWQQTLYAQLFPTKSAKRFLKKED